MSCYHPLVLRRLATHDGLPAFTPDGKPAFKMISASEVTFDDATDSLRYKLVPCGHCIGCRLDYSRTWADRLMLELQYHDVAWFVTLTYNDDNAPVSGVFDDDTGEWIGGLTLDKRDCQLFLKRLRKHFSDDRIRFYLAGEYGPSTFRPHYHAIIFGLHLDDLQPFSRSTLGYQYFLSPVLSRIWSKGFVLVGAVSWDTCAYTARYVTKKYSGDLADQAYGQFGLVPPFSLMSRKPGIGRQYYDDHPDICRTGKAYISTEDGSRTIRSPTYFNRLFAVDFPEEAEQNRLIRERMARHQVRAVSQRTDLATYSEYLSVCEDYKQKVIKSLKREVF